MSVINLSRFFNVEYFDKAFGVSPNMFESNQELLNARPKTFVLAELPGQNAFNLQVEYPGLMAGVGYPHAAGEESEICAGCSLDYVTGMPYLPGSSVKGLLRSAFKHEGYIKELLENEEVDVKAVEEDVFENSDIFLDAYPVDGMRNGVLELENITPHHTTKLGTLDEPKPLTFVKVKPGVVYQFRFILQNGDILSAEKKLDLFKQIILDLGIGAKTNVGFGRFTDEICLTERVSEERSSTPAPARQPAPSGFGEGKCKKCGKPVGKNQRTNRWYDYCFACNNQSRR